MKLPRGYQFYISMLYDSICDVFSNRVLASSLGDNQGIGNGLLYLRVYETPLTNNSRRELNLVENGDYSFVPDSPDLNNHTETMLIATLFGQWLKCIPS